MDPLGPIGPMEIRLFTTFWDNLQPGGTIYNCSFCSGEIIYNQNGPGGTIYNPVGPFTTRWGHLQLSKTIPMYQANHTRVSSKSYPCIKQIIPLFQANHTPFSSKSYPCIKQIRPLYQANHTPFSSKS